MGEDGGWRARATALGHRWHARRAARARPEGPPIWPEPRLAGDPGRGRRVLAGHLRLAAGPVELRGRSLWDLGAEGPDARELHAWGWLDDLMATGEPLARAQAQAWVAEWLSRYGGGKGPGWTPVLAAGRLARLLGHAQALLHPPGVGKDRLSGAAAAHERFVAARLRSVPPGGDRLGVLAALVVAGLSLPGRRAAALRAARAMGQEASRAVDAGGAVATRNPEELLDVLALLAEANQALAAADLPPDPAIAAALSRGAPTLRALRHADGGLARFHGGGAGPEGRLDQVLAAAGRPSLNVGAGALPLHMGYLRLAAGRTTVVVDAAPPPLGPASTRAHASTLAFELTSGRRPLVVGVGPGEAFGERWRRVARATASHSTLALEDLSSSRLGARRPGEGGERIVEAPSRVPVEAAHGPGGPRAEIAHDGWRSTHGLTHARLLRLSSDGRVLEGEDLLTTLTAADTARLERAVEATGGLGVAFAVRFHLHPEAEAAVDAQGDVALGLRSGEEWVFSHDGEGALSLEESAWLEAGRLRPRPALQVVLAARAVRPLTRLRWTLAKAYGTPEGLRDLHPGPERDEEDE